MKTKARIARFRDGDGPSLKKGKVNQNQQRCGGTLDVPGKVAGELAYKMECRLCGFVYGASGGEVSERKCPNCQDGEPGIRYWLITRKVPVNPGEDNGSAGTRVEYDTIETAADWFDKHSGSLKDLPGAEEFLEECRRIREADRWADDDDTDET
jgi:hypothetical protein